MATKMSITENVGGMSSYLSGLGRASAYTDFKMDVTKALNRIPGIGPGMGGCDAEDEKQHQTDHHSGHAV